MAQLTRDPNTSESSVGGPPGSHGASDINAAADAIKAGNPSPELALAIRKGYEPHDISLRGIYIFGAVLVATLVAALIIVAGVMKGLLMYDTAVDPKSSPVIVERPPTQIPLQPSVSHDEVDHTDMTLMRAHVQEILSGAGQHGDRRWIPIDQAMDKVLPMLPIGVAAGAAPAAASSSRNTPPAGTVDASASLAAGTPYGNWK